MKKQYFAWKNGKQNLNGKQEWQELTSQEFLELCYSNSKRPKEEKRYFARVPGVEDGDTYFVLECTYEEFLRSDAERKLRKRKRDETEQLKADGLWYDLISFDDEVDDGDGNTVTLHDMVADENSVFETGLVELIDLESALKVLTSNSHLQHLLYLLYAIYRINSTYFKLFLKVQPKKLERRSYVNEIYSFYKRTKTNSSTDGYC